MLVPFVTTYFGLLQKPVRPSPRDLAPRSVSFMRSARSPDDVVVMVFNFTPVPRTNYRLGVPSPGFYGELVNSDSTLFGGSNLGNGGGVSSEPVGSHGFSQSIRLMVPPLACLLLKKA